MLTAHARHRRTTWNHRQKVVPTTAHTAAMLVDEFLERDRHGFFDDARVVHVARDGKDLGTSVVLAAKAREPCCTPAQDRWNDGNRLDIVHGRRAAIEARARRERRLHAGHALFALKAFQQRGFLAANVCAGAVVQVNVEIPPRAGSVLADETRVIAFVDRGLERFFLADVLAADIDVAGVRVHREAGDQTAFDQRVRIVSHDLPVFAGARLGFVSVHNQIGRTPVAFLGHEGPLQPCGEPRTTATAQPAGLGFLDNPVAALLDQVARVVPMTPRPRASEAAVVHPVEVCEDTIFVFKHVRHLCSRVAYVSLSGQSLRRFRQI